MREHRVVVVVVVMWWWSKVKEQGVGVVVDIVVVMVVMVVMVVVVVGGVVWLLGCKGGCGVVIGGEEAQLGEVMVVVGGMEVAVITGVVGHCHWGVREVGQWGVIVVRGEGVGSRVVVIRGKKAQAWVVVVVVGHEGVSCHHQG
jgi:hypothetical protein